MGKFKVHVSKIPRSSTGLDLVELLEPFVGKGAIYNVSIMSDPQTCESRGYGWVSFNTEEAADKAAMMGENGHLVLLNSHLRVTLANRDIVKRPRHSVTTWEDGKLYLSSLVSESFASWQWSSSSSITTEFAFDIRKVQFMVDLMRNGDKQYYKMEIEFEEIETVKLVAVQGAPTRTLLLQLRTPPHLYLRRAMAARARDFIEDMFLGTLPAVNPYHIQTEEEDLWVRTVDFTPLKSIGQCSTYLLELSCARTGDDLIDLFKKLADFRLAAYPPQIQQLTLQKGPSFAISQELVPMVEPPKGVNVEFDLIFRVNQLVQTLKLSGEALNSAFYESLQPPHEAKAKLALNKIANGGTRCWEPLKEIKQEVANSPNVDSVSIKLAPGLSWVRRVLVTPTKVYCTGPEADTSNRVTRHYSKHADRFMRMSFVDENLEPLMSNALSVPTSGGAQAGMEAERSPVYNRILAALKEGFVLGGRKFEFLAFSSSQLREQSVWMFASDEKLTAAGIREWMGDFLSIRNVAKCAARMGQCFSSSTPTLEVEEHEVDQIPDIEREDEFGMSKYCFSDGIGKISEEFACEVAKKYGAKKREIGDAVPSAFQIRYGGYKGVVAVDPHSKAKLSLRPSMRKFASKHVGLDILNASRFLPSYLNRQIILLLSTLGVPDSAFEQLQRRVVSKLDKMMTDANVARDVLQVNHSGEMHTRLVEMLAAGYEPQREPFVKMLLQAFRASQLLDLRTRARILQPKGRVLIGCLDETKVLSYGEVFLQVTPAPGRRQVMRDGLEDFEAYPVGREANGKVARVVEGWVVVAKNPCLHPGDIRVLKACNIPGLRHMVDCLVFPQKGHRPHPNECSGSDLDGDLYFVSWDKNLIPPRTDDPMDYSSPGAMNLDHPVTIEEIQEFFVKYMVTDSLGVISHAHLVHADCQPLMTRSVECQELAKLVSIAVDFPKTGVPAIIPQNLRPKRYPDFMEKEDKQTYESERVLGKLYRQVKAASLEKMSLVILQDDIEQAFDTDMVVRGYEEFIDLAKYHKNLYDRKLIGLMNQYGIETEAEAVSGNILNLARQHSLPRRKGDVVERIRDAVKSLTDEARQWFERNADDLVDDDCLAKASAWYHATYHPDHIKGSAIGRRQVHLLSFPWAVFDVLLKIKRAAGATRVSEFQGSHSSSAVE